MSMPHLTVGSRRSNSIKECLDAIASKTGAADGSPDIFAEKAFPERVVRGPSELIVSSTTESVLRVTPLFPLGKTGPENLRRPSSGGNLSDALTGTTSRMNRGRLKGCSSSWGAHNNSSANRKARREACRMSTPSAEANPGLWANILSGVECPGGSAHGIYRAGSGDAEDDSSEWTTLDEAPSDLASELSFSGDGRLPEDLPEGSFETSLEPDNHQQAALEGILPFALFNDAGLNIDSFYDAHVGSELFEDSRFIDVNKQDPGVYDVADDEHDCSCVSEGGSLGRGKEDQTNDPFEDLAIEDIDALLAADEHLLSAEAYGTRYKDGHVRDTGMGVAPLPTPRASRTEKWRTAEPSNTTDCDMFVKLQGDCSLLGKVHSKTGGASLEKCEPYGTNLPSAGSVTDGRGGAERDYPMTLKLIDPPLKRNQQSRTQGSPCAQSVLGREMTDQVLKDAGRTLVGAVPVMDLCGRVRVSTLRKQPTPQRTTAEATSVARPHHPSRHSIRSTAKPESFSETVPPTQPMSEILTDWAGKRPQGESKINTEVYYDIAEPSQHLSSHLPARATTTKSSGAEAPVSRWRPIVATQPVECPQDASPSSHETLEATQDMGQLVNIQDNILAGNSRGMNFEDASISSTPPPPTSPSEYPGVKKQRMLIAGGESSEALNALPQTQPMNPHSMPFWSLPPTQPMVEGTLGHQSIPIN
ncbi:hypothetical protein FOZ61_006827 [Perkinsus olseni]|uniref:Uncharacterized protein n=1 Tax=Perkinsus olseni TaxID=32597 RepID=A0A7J6MWS1_PEROL|nr:hypothetical protein FOZ61_006827 [Perkinsus olseni]KAF4676069.1 hypothetical protein FOL46_007947 [Perkinsus olseni]